MQDKFTKPLLLAVGVLLGVLVGTTLLRQDNANAQVQRGGGLPAGAGAVQAAAMQSGDGGVAVGVSGPFVFIVHAKGAGAELSTYVYHCDPTTRKVTSVTP